MLDSRCVQGDFQRVLFTSTKLRYEHKPVTPGMQIAYKVRAKRADLFSSFSAVSVVYLTAAAPTLTISKAASSCLNCDLCDG